MKQLIVFNHNYERVVDPVVGYNRRFGLDITIAGPFRRAGALTYCSGSYLWQGAIIEYLRSLKETGDVEATLIVHDDVAINPHMTLEDRFEAGHIGFGPIYPVQGELWSWHWNFRLATNWFTSKSVLFGHGVDSCVDTLKSTALYRRNKAHIDSLPMSQLTVSADQLAGYPPIVKTYLETYHGGRDRLDFELPLYCGNSDFIVLPPGHANEIVDFLEASVQCGLFVEVAIPTMLRWLNVPIRHLTDELHFPFGAEYTKFDGFRSTGDIEHYFSEHPNLYAIHPVKFSRFQAPE